MSYTLEEKYKLIKDEVIKSGSDNPITIAKSVMDKDFVSMHGPEHHFLDGAAFLMAYKNAGGEIDIDAAITELAERTVKMPGAMCGLWGICGSATAVGAALSIIHGTRPISDDEYYKEHMKLTSLVISKMSEIGGPRCCKRNAFISLSTGAEFVSERYGIRMDNSNDGCRYSDNNEQCIKERCPYFI